VPKYGSISFLVGSSYDFFALVRFSLGDDHGEVCGGFIWLRLGLFCAVANVAIN
jgi:hypothetical protein